MRRPFRVILIIIGIFLAAAAIRLIWAYIMWVHGAPDDQTRSLNATVGSWHIALAMAILAIGTTAVTIWGWLRHRGSGDDDALERLAEEIGKQWRFEVIRWRLNEPQLEVSWTAAPPDLVEDWSSLRKLAETGIGWPRPSAPVEASAASLAGHGAEILDRWQKVPTHRLVVLGEAGSGKTTLLLRLLLDMLQARRTNPDLPVPILVSVASWRPVDDVKDVDDKQLITWLERRMIMDYPWLARPSRDNGRQTTLAHRLIMTRRLALLLDGFDEIAPCLQHRALRAVSNAALQDGQALVLGGRTDAYRAAVRASPEQPAKLHAAGIEMSRFDPATVVEYLRKVEHKRESAVGTSDRWKEVAEAVESGGPLADALTTPLMAMLARTVYEPTEGGSTRTTVVPSPAHLTTLRTRDDVERHLFGSYVPAAFRPRAGHRCRFKPDRADAWLRSLAEHLQKNRGGDADLAWWQLKAPDPGGATRGVLALLTAVLLGLVAGVAACSTFTYVFAHFNRGLYTGGIAAVAVTTVCVAIYLVTRRLAATVSSGLAAGLTSGFASAIVADLVKPPEVGTSLAIVAGLAVGMAYPARSDRPRSGWTAIRTGAAFTVVMTISFGWAAQFDIRGTGEGRLSAGVSGNLLAALPLGAACGVAATVVVALAWLIPPSSLSFMARPGWRRSWRDSGLTAGTAAGSAVGLFMLVCSLLGSLPLTVPPDAEKPIALADALAHAVRDALSWGIPVGVTIGLAVALVSARRDPERGRGRWRSRPLPAALVAAVPTALAVGLTYRLNATDTLYNNLGEGDYRTYTTYEISDQLTSAFSIGVASGLVVALIVGLAIHLIAALIQTSGEPGEPARDAVLLGLGTGTGTALIIGVAYWFSVDHSSGRNFGLAAGAITAVVVGASVFHIAHLRATPADEERPIPRWVAPAITATAFATLLFGITYGFTHGLTAGLGVALITTLLGRIVADRLPARTVTPTPRGLLLALGVGNWVLVVVGLTFGGSVGLVVGSVAGLTTGLAYGLNGVPLAPGTPDSPRRVLAQDRRMYLVVAGLLVVTVPLAVATTVDALFDLGREANIGAGVASGVTYGLIFGLLAAAGQTMWGRYLLIRTWLALRGRMSWRFMGFLVDAHRHHGVLRQSGAHYQFRHINLQRQLGGREATETPAP